MIEHPEDQKEAGWGQRRWAYLFDEGLVMAAPR
jgi:hypothetical protein